MSNAIDLLQELLLDDDLEKFLDAFESYAATGAFDPKCMTITQVKLPDAIRRQFLSKKITPKTVVSIWRLVSNGVLLLVEDDLRILINQHIDDALKSTQPAARPARPLAIFQEFTSSSQRFKSRKTRPNPEAVVEQMKRISIVSTFEVRTWSSHSAFDLRRNVCSGLQEKEFLRAVRQYFPTMLSYPNVPLQSFIDLQGLGSVIPDGLEEFARRSQVDVLLCTPEEDPIAGFELDATKSIPKQEAKQNKLKSTLFQLAGIPLVRIRHEDPSGVRAEDFYDLLNIEKIEELVRPHRMRARRTHDSLVPATADPLRSWR